MKIQPRDVAILEINALEGRIVAAEDDADSMLWEQARQVVELLNAGVTVRQLATQWKNPRNNNEPYSRGHVYWTKLTHGHYSGQSPRPQFRKAYEAVKKPQKQIHVPEPFHYLLAVGDLRKTVEKMVSSWPVESRGLAPRALRTLAAQLESELGGADVGRRDRITGPGSSVDTPSPNGVARAS